MEEKQVLARLQRQCARAEYCSQDVRRKALKALDGDGEAADRVTASLVADRFVDDRRYAAAYAREKSALQGWGAVKIRFMLQGKGIAREDVEEALRDIDPVRAASKLERLAAERYRHWKEDPQCRLKLLKFLLGRGYPYEAASEAVEALLRQR